MRQPCAFAVRAAVRGSAEGRGQGLPGTLTPWQRSQQPGALQEMCVSADGNKEYQISVRTYMGRAGAPLAEQRQRVAGRGRAVGQRLGGRRVGRQRVQARLRQRERDRQHARRSLACRLRRAARRARGGGPAPRPRGSPGAAAAAVAALCARRGRRAAARRACARRRCSCIFFFFFVFLFILHNGRRPHERGQHALLVRGRPAAAAAAGWPGPRTRPLIIEVHRAAARIRLVRASAAARGGTRRVGRSGRAGVAAQGHARVGRQRVAQA